MKVKELQKTVNVAWSPVQQQSILLAAGTAAQQLDASSAAVLEIYATNLSEPGYDMILKGSQASPYRFHKLVWSPLGHGGQYANGVIVAGCESGHLQVYNAAKLLAGEDAVMSTQDKHTGPVRALDFNPFQNNLLASGAAESEILIWDLNNTSTPMTPGTKTQPFEDIQNVGWNKQVQHILASVFSTRCVVWDLRKNEPIIKLSDSQSRVRWRALQWHPDVATQLWLASEEDQAPVVQLWDLRYATSPAKSMLVHQRGILGLSWCPCDTDLMVSCGKDNKILCWNPNSEIAGDEILSEIASTIQWYSDVQWCPRNPALIASASLEGNVSIYSLFGGSQQQVQTSNKIADSFPGMDAFVQAPLPQNNAAPIVCNDLRKPPKWMKRPVGASFGFGGKLVTFNSSSRKLTINQVITEPELVERSNKLEDVLANGNYEEYCRQKADQMTDQHGRFVWYFIKANFDKNPRAEMLNLLGYSADEMEAKFGKVIPRSTENDGVDNITQKMGDLSRSNSSESGPSTDDSTDSSAVDNNAVFDAIAADQKTQSVDEVQYKIKTGADIESMICQALLTGRTEAAVELCLKDERYADAVIIAMTDGPELLARTQYRYLQKREDYLSNIISALVTEDWMGVVSQCTTDSWKEALAATLTHSKEQMPTLCAHLGERLHHDNVIESAILCFICAGNVEKLVESWPVLTKADQQINDLQNLVEIVMLLQKALELQGRQTGASGKLADLLSKYSGLLAAQGALGSALTYLGPSDDPQIIDLRERLYHSLGHKQAYAQRASQAQNQYNPANNRFQHPRTSIPNNNYNNTAQISSSFAGYVPPQVQQTQQQIPAWQPQPAPMNAWNTAANPTPIIPAMPAVGPPPPGASMAQPPRPSSVGSQGSAPSASRSKYLLDPSVQSGSTGYGQTSNLYAPPTNAHQPANTSVPFIHQQPQSSFQPMMPTNNQLNHFVPFTPTPAHNTEALSGVPPIELAQQALTQKNPTPPPGWNDPPALKTSRKPYYDVDQHHQQQLNREMSAEHAGTRKWNKIIKSRGDSPKRPVISDRTFDNDDEIDSGKSRVQSAPRTNQTAAMYGGQDMNQMINGMLDPNAHQPQIQPPTMNAFPPPQPTQHQQFPHVNQPQLMPGGMQPTPQPPSSFQTQPLHQANQSQQQQQHQQPPQYAEQMMHFQTQPIQHGPPVQSHPKPQTPEPPKPKLPLPEEYVYLQTVFNELKQQCINTASNPQTKRKLEDVGKRLECLFDLLRENRLSPSTLTSLNQLVQLVQTGDYANGLGLHTQMVSGPDFSQIASFMPGIKVLLQTAMQLQVYLR